MKTLLKRLRMPQASTIISVLALFVALTTTAWAASLPKNSVGGKQLKKNSVTSSKIKRSAVTSSDVKNDSLTGTDINESSLGTVPSATSAGTANTANAANSVNGAKISRIDYNAESGPGEVEILNTGGLQLIAGCVSGNPTLIARTSADDAAIHWSTATLNTVATANEGTVNTYAENDFFDVGGDTNLLSMGNTLLPDLDDSTQNSLTYRSSSGSIVTATYMVEDETIWAGPGTCHIVGTAVTS